MNNLIERAKERLGSYAEVADLLGVDRTAINAYRKKGAPAWVRGKLAELLGDDVFRAELEGLAEQERSEQGREYWLKKLKDYRQKSLF